MRSPDGAKDSTARVRAAWWWIDRWRKSTAYTDMTVEERGAYRELLDELWLRGGVIPSDERILARIVGDTEAWQRVRKAVLARFQVTPEGLRNDTHDKIQAESEKRAERQSRYRERLSNSDRNVTPNVAASPSPSPLRTSVPPSEHREGGVGGGRANPLMGERPKRESELLQLVAREGTLTNRDPVEVMCEVTGYEGARTSKLNPASMTDDRLLNSLLDARARVARLEKREVERGRPTV